MLMENNRHKCMIFFPSIYMYMYMNLWAEKLQLNV